MKTRIILDVGLPLGDCDRNLEVPGLFSAGRRVDGIFLSHAHMDHCGLLPKAQAEIPIYLSKGTDKMLMTGALFAGQNTGRGRERHELRPGVRCQVGDMSVTPYAVDHSAFDAMAFLVEGDGKRLLYSGDLRLHGRKPGMARELKRAVRKLPLDCLLMEGTNLGNGRGPGLFEHELEGYLREQIAGAPSLVLAAFSPMHVDRMVTFYKAARKTGRVLVLDAYGAFVMHLASGQARIPRPTARNGVRVFYTRSFRRIRRGLESSALKKGRAVPKLHSLFHRSRIEMQAILRDPTHYVMLFRPSMLAQDFGGMLPAKVKCFYSYWGGYLDRPSWQEAREQIEGADGQVNEAHTSGHIFAEDIDNFVRELRPKVVVPIHTTTPMALARSQKRLFLKDGFEVDLNSTNRKSKYGR